MPSALFLDWTSSSLACPFFAASLAMTVAAVACAFTLSSSPIGSSFPHGVRPAFHVSALAAWSARRGLCGGQGRGRRGYLRLGAGRRLGLGLRLRGLGR